ncbi:MAG: hypothetical protein KatS3mg054_0098 [Chloroflexus sp.]|nr:MAG: hypothetical protein KatS3mg054_0098 [Chloroflexus sp.]
MSFVGAILSLVRGKGSPKKKSSGVPDIGSTYGYQNIWASGDVASAFVNNSPWLRSVVGTIATSVAMTPIRVYAPTRGSKIKSSISYAKLLSAQNRTLFVRNASTSGDLELVDDEHPLVRLLNGSESTFTGFMLMYTTQVHQELAGEAFWFLETNSFGVPISAIPIPPHAVTSIPKRPGEPYIISSGGISIEVPYRLIVYFKWPNPIYPSGRGSGIGVALRNEIGADKAAAEVISRRFASQAIPPLIMNIKNVGENELRKIKEYWLNEAHALWTAGIPFLINHEFEAKEAGINFQSMQFAELRQIQRDIFINAFGIPPELIGHQKNANRSTITAAEYLYNKLRILPRLEFNRQVIQNYLASQYDDKILVHYDNPIDEDRDFQLRAFQSMPDTVTVDEWRTKVQGLPPIGPGRGGDKFLISTKRSGTSEFDNQDSSISSNDEPQDEQPARKPQRR